MGIDIEKALYLIAQRPMIRSVEIADIIDCDIDQVEPALQSRISARLIVVHPITAPNGRPANGYEFSQAFKETAEYRELAQSPAATVKPEPEPSTPAQKGSKAQLAIAYIQGKPNQMASTQELRAPMGLTAGEYPSSHLRYALSTGQLACTAQVWRLGPALGGSAKPPPPDQRHVGGRAAKPTAGVDAAPSPPAAHAPLRQPSAAAALNVSSTAKGFAALHQSREDEEARLKDERAAQLHGGPDVDPIEPAEPILDQALDQAATPVVGGPVADLEMSAVAIEVVALPPDPPALQTFRCGIWSDGEVELQRAGQTIAILSMGELAYVKSFMAGVRA